MKSRLKSWNYDSKIENRERNHVNRFLFIVNTYSNTSGGNKGANKN